MHVHFLLMNAFSLGGTIRTTLNTAAALALRHDVEVVSVYQRRETARFPVDERVRIRVLSDQVPPDRDLAAHPLGRCTGLDEALRRVPSVLVPTSERRYRNFSLLTDLRLAAYLRSLEAGVLVTTRPALNLAAARLARPSVVRVGQEHMFLANHPGALRARIARHYPRLDLVSTLTERDADDYRALLAGRTPVVRMPNAAPATSLTAAGTSKVVVAAGRLVLQKGFDLLVDAWSLVARTHPEWELHIYGAGEDRAALENRIRRHGLAGQVRLMGYTDDLLRRMSEASVYVMSSRAEGFPMVLLEAMAVGLPVVSFDCRNGPADLICSGRNGVLVPARDVPGLARAISALLDDPVRRAALGRAAQQTARRYDLAAISAQWEAVFEDLVQAKSARTARGRRA